MICTPYAYPEGPDQKAELVAAARAHQEADAYVQGEYGIYNVLEFRGCSIGCTIKSLGGNKLDDHGWLAEQIFGGVRAIPRMQEWVFEELPSRAASAWTPDFLEAVPVYADLRPVVARMIIWVLTDPIHGVKQYVEDVEPVDHVAGLWTRRMNGDDPTRNEWTVAQHAVEDRPKLGGLGQSPAECARAASWDAVCLATDPTDTGVAALDVVWSAASAAAWGAPNVDLVTALDPAWDRARRNYIFAYRDQFLRELRSAPTHAKGGGDE